MGYFPRSMESILLKAAKQSPALIVTGPRQAGKTTILKRLFGSTHRYVSLDAPDTRLMANREPLLFLENYPAPVIIDEIQYVPELFSYLKIKIDEQRSRKGQFLLTGSQSFPLMAGISESLAGRIFIFSLLSLSMSEQIDPKELTLDRLKSLLLRGGFPELAVDSKQDVQLWFKNYLQTYLERDLRQLRQVGDLLDFQRFMFFLAALNGQVINYSNVARDLGIAVNTVRNWISALAASHQIILVAPYFKNKGKRIIKSPKMYFLDTGLLCFLNRIMTKEQIFDGPFSGQLLETAVLGEIVRSFYNRGEAPAVYWWRTSNGEEVDFIVEREGRLVPIEVKVTSRSENGLVKALQSFCRLFDQEVDHALLVNLSPEKVVMGKKISIVPFKNFLSEKVLV